MPKSKYLERFLAVFSWPAVVEEFAKLDEDPEGVSGKGFPETTGAEAETAEPDSDARFAAQQEQMNALQCRLLDNEAEKFYLLALSECRVVPAERETLIAQFKQAVADDNAPEVSGRGRPETTASVSGKGFPETTSVACFSADGVLNEGSRLTLLKAGVAARPKHDLSSERLESLIKDKGEIVAFEANPKSTDDPEAKKLTKERRKELIDAGTIKVG